VQTGFVVQGTKGIYTALHGVVDATHIGAYCQAADKGFSNLVISKVDVERDVPLLDSQEIDGKNLPGLDRTNYSESVNPSFAVSNRKRDSERFVVLNVRHLRREKYG
jgi:hypothetical protein